MKWCKLAYSRDTNDKPVSPFLGISFCLVGRCMIERDVVLWVARIAVVLGFGDNGYYENHKNIVRYNDSADDVNLDEIWDQASKIDIVPKRINRQCQ